MATKSKSTTRQLVQIADIRDNIVLLNNGSLRAVLEVSAINFELRSEEEQNAILQNFQQFLNSIDFPLQIVTHSRRFDVDDYLQVVQETTGTLTNELLKIQAEEYISFIKELSSLANIMSKKFYIVIPFYLSEAPTAKNLLDSVRGLFKSAASGPAKIPEEQLQAYKNQILQRAELVFGGLVGIGVRARVLEQQELMELFYQLYNPGQKLQQ